MNEEVKDYLQRVDQEGLDYATIHYDDWKQIKGVDPKLYGLIKDLQDAYTKLEIKVDALTEEIGDKLWD